MALRTTATREETHPAAPAWRPGRWPAFRPASLVTLTRSSSPCRPLVGPPPPVHGLGEGIAARAVVGEHVHGGTSRGQEHRVAGVSQRRGPGHDTVHGT